MTDAPPAEPSKRSTDRTTRFDRWGIAVLSSFTSIVIAVLGVVGAAKAGIIYVGTGDQPTKTVTVTTTPRPLADNRSTTQSESEGTVARTGRLSLTSGYCADLDSDAADWNVAGQCNDARSTDKPTSAISPAARKASTSWATRMA